MSVNAELIIPKVEALFDDMVSVRRHLHMHPELSFKEHKTAAFIESELTRSGIPHERIVKTGVLAKIKGRNPESKRIVLRGDIDALPIQEDTGLDFASINDGVMHACGHDVHTTCVLGAARVLREFNDQFTGTVEILFQPAEEKLPGGASMILEAGVFEKHAPSAFVGQHIYPELESGKVGFKPGQYMASTDELYVKVLGPGGHAALPEKTVDVIYAASALIQQFQQIVSRNARASVPSVLTFGKITGMGATNVIPREVSLEGTFRTMDERWREKAHKRMDEIAQGISKSTNAEVELEVRKGYPSLVNDEQTTTIVREAAEEILGKENVVDLEMRMTAEDFAYFTQSYPSCFYRLGTRKPGTEAGGLHTPNLIIDESSIKVGISVMCNAALKLLEGA